MGLTLIEVKFGQKLIQIKTLILNNMDLIRGPLFFVVTKWKTRKEKTERGRERMMCFVHIFNWTGPTYFGVSFVLR